MKSVKNKVQRKRKSYQLLQSALKWAERPKTRVEERED